MAESKRRILITGVSGQVGAALVPRFQDQEVISADRSILDLTQQDEIAPVLETLNPAVIINAAAYTAVDRAENQQNLAALINGDAPGAIARWAAARSVPLIHFSTDYVFDGSGDSPWREDDATNPLSVYGRTKLDGEHAIRAAGGTFLILRTSWVYSATGKNFLRTIAQLARERKELQIVADQFGAPTTAALIADSLKIMLDGDPETFQRRCTQCNGIVHLAASGQSSWHNFACTFVEGLRKRDVKFAVEKIIPIKTDEYPTPARRPRNSRLDLAKLNQVFGIVPVHWRDALDPELDALAVELR